jgi:carboxyl-terminal processing protease
VLTPRSLPHLDRHVARVFVALVLVAAMSACAGGRRGDADPSPHAVLAVAYENLADRYLDPVSIDQVAMHGLERLKDFDPALAVSRGRGAVRLTYGGSELAARPEPGAHDALGWAWLTADMMETARQASPKVKQHPIDDLYDAIFAGSLAGLDAYTRYASPAVARRARESREGFGGVGVTIGVDDGVTSIVAVHDGSPAEKAGLKANDVITHINGQPIAGLPQDDIVGRLRGQTGSDIRLTIRRKGNDAPFDVSMSRTHVVPPTVIARRDGNVLTLRVTSFNQRTATSMERELRRALREGERPATGVVLDLRGNPGGLLDQAVEVADLFLGEGRIVSTVGRHPDSNQTFDATSGATAEKVPLIILVNGRSASSAEVVAAALADRGRALLIGSTTYGKGTVQTIVRLPNGGEMTMTWSRLYSPAGRLVQERGVVPAVCVADDEIHAGKIINALRVHRATVQLVTDLPSRAAEGCPRGDGEMRNVDAEIARRLLAEPALYTAIIDSKRPNVAAR